MTNPTKEPRGANPPYAKKDRIAMGKALRLLRTEQDITQSELAHAIGFKRQANISHIESGLKGITRSKLVKAARYLGVRPEALVVEGDAA